MKKNHFITTGVDKCSAKSMFEFINNHYRYYTMNSWNRLNSIAHNVKIYNLGLDGDPWTAYAIMEDDEWETVNEMIRDWEREHPGYCVGFNGRSGGYLVLYNKNNNGSVVPDCLEGWETYKDWKKDIKGGWGGYYDCVKDYLPELRETTELIQAFDRLCEDIREYANHLSQLNGAVIAMENTLQEFAYRYEDDLDALDISVDDLVIDAAGKIDISVISDLQCLKEAFLRLAKAENKPRLHFDAALDTAWYEV